MGSPRPLGRPCAPSPPGAAAPHCYSASTQWHDRTSGCSASLRPSASPSSLSSASPSSLVSALRSTAAAVSPSRSLARGKTGGGGSGPAPARCSPEEAVGKQQSAGGCSSRGWGRGKGEAKRLVSCSMEDQKRRRGNSSPPAAAPRADGEQGRGRRSLGGSSFYRRRGRTRSRGRAGRSVFPASAPLSAL